VRAHSAKSCVVLLNPAIEGDRLAPEDAPYLRRDGGQASFADGPPDRDARLGQRRRLRTTFKLAIAARSRGDGPRDLDRARFVLPHLVEALAHGAAYGRLPNLSVTAAKAEAVRAVLAYLRS
jgi:hypothetical protein